MFSLQNQWRWQEKSQEKVDMIRCKEKSNEYSWLFSWPPCKTLLCKINCDLPLHESQCKLPWGTNSLLLILQYLLLLRGGSFHDVITKWWYGVCRWSRCGHSGHSRTGGGTRLLGGASGLRASSLWIFLTAGLCLLSTHMMVIFPVLVLTEWSTVPRHIAAATCFSGLSAAIPTTLREEQRISP